MAGSKKLAAQASWPASVYPSEVELDGEGSSSGSSAPNQQQNSRAVMSYNVQMEEKDYASFRGRSLATSAYSAHSRDPAVPVPSQNHTQRQRNQGEGRAPCGCERAHK